MKNCLLAFLILGVAGCSSPCMPCVKSTITKPRPRHRPKKAQPLPPCPGASQVKP